jgi:hypothetical protein
MLLLVLATILQLQLHSDPLSACYPPSALRLESAQPIQPSILGDPPSREWLRQRERLQQRQYLQEPLPARQSEEHLA